MDVRVGGARLVCMEMETPNGPMQMWFTGEYREVVENQRLVYTESMSHENGNVLSPSDPGMPEGHPATTEVIVELEDLGGRTKMVMTHIGIPEGSPGAAGWTMAFDKLAALVEGQSNRKPVISRVEQDPVWGKRMAPGRPHRTRYRTASPLMR